MNKNMPDTKLFIGRYDLAEFPELNLKKIQVKIDTGAYTSSFHCHTIRLINTGGKEKLQCYFLDPGHVQYNNKEFIFDCFSLKKVRSSNGVLEERYSIQTTICLFEKVIPLELTLTERENMRFPVLLGRKFLSRRFVVDSSKKNLSARGIARLARFVKETK